MMLADLVTQYDTLALLEVVGSGVEVVLRLLEAVQAYCAGLRKTIPDSLRALYCDYDVILSPRLGRGTYKEHVAVFYRKQRVKPVLDFVEPYEELKSPSFLARWFPSLFSSNARSSSSSSSSSSEDDSKDSTGALRYPYVTLFERLNAKQQQTLMFTWVHLSPLNVVAEMDLLAHAYKKVKRQVQRSYSLSSSLVLGDLNADGAYLKGRDLFESELYNSFYWPQPYARAVFGHPPLGTTTTLSSRDYMYDRVLVDRQYEMSVVKDSGRAFRWPDVVDLRHVEKSWRAGGGLAVDRRALKHPWKAAGMLSDHLPVEVMLE
jgi:hypothetical protein